MFSLTTTPYDLCSTLCLQWTSPASLRALCLDSRAATSSVVCWLLEASSDTDTGCVLPACYRSQAENGIPLCRHMDGVWRSADEAPRGADGRLLAHVALNGHGSYPTAGFIPRNLLAFNDYTSIQGAVWDPVSVSTTLACPHTAGLQWPLPMLVDMGTIFRAGRASSSKQRPSIVPVVSGIWLVHRSVQDNYRSTSTGSQGEEARAVRGQRLSTCQPAETD